MEKSVLDKSNYIVAFSIITVKVLLILLIIPLLGNIIPGFYQVEGFYDRYDYIAKNLLEGNGYKVYPDTSETMLRLPGFVYLLTALFWAFGDSLFAFKIVNLLCSFLTAMLVYKIVLRHLKANTTVAWLASISYLFYPAIILAESRGGVEIVYTLSVVGFVYYFLEAFGKEKIASYIVSGCFLAVSVIVKSTTLIMPPFILAFMIIAKRKQVNLFDVVIRVGLLSLPMLVLLTPWAIRNYQLVEEIVITQSNLGTTAYQGMYVNENWSSSKPHYILIREATKELSAKAQDLGMEFRYDFFQHFYTAKDEFEFNRLVTSEVKQRYVDSPMLLVKNCFLNFFRFWFQGRSWSSTIMNLILVAPFLLLCVFGFFRSEWKNVAPIFLVYFSAVFVASHLPILATARYQVPLIPILSTFFAFAIYNIYISYIACRSRAIPGY